MSTISYSASLRLRAISSTQFATSSDLRFGRVLPVMIPTLRMVSPSGTVCQHGSLLQLLRCASHGGRAEFLEQLNEGRALVLRKPTRRQVHRRLVDGEHLGGLLFARYRQPN